MMVYTLPASVWHRDTFAQLVAGDEPCLYRPDTLRGERLAYDDTTPMAAYSNPFVAKAISGSLNCVIKCHPEQANVGTFTLEVFLESVAVGDSIDLTTASAWGSANSGNTTGVNAVGAPLEISLTLTSLGGWGAGKETRVGIRRPSGGAAGLLFITTVELSHDTP